MMCNIYLASVIYRNQKEKIHTHTRVSTAQSLLIYSNLNHAIKLFKVESETLSIITAAFFFIAMSFIFIKFIQIKNKTKKREKN